MNKMYVFIDPIIQKCFNFLFVWTCVLLKKNKCETIKKREINVNKNWIQLCWIDTWSLQIFFVHVFVNNFMYAYLMTIIMSSFVLYSCICSKIIVWTSYILYFHYVDIQLCIQLIKFTNYFVYLFQNDCIYCHKEFEHAFFKYTSLNFCFQFVLYFTKICLPFSITIE